MTLFKQLLHNRTGRDFVVGDLHGQLGFLERVLEYHAFDRSRDRLICVGDLVNRGADSLALLRLLGEPWFYAVAGNHERRLSQYARSLTDRTLDDEGFRFLETIGADWLLGPYRQLNDDKWADLITEVMNLIQQMPVLMQVGHGDTAVGVVHAQLPSLDWNTNVSRLERMKKQRFWASEHDELSISAMLHGRAQLRDALSGSDVERKVEGIGWLLAGHTVVPHPVRAGNRVWLDTGAYRGGAEHGLTIAEVGERLKVSTHFRDLRVVTRRFDPQRQLMAARPL